MANRRMFAKSITGSARFLRMPVSARLLYYDLGMQADDEGVVEAFTVIRMTGAAESDLRALAERRFIRILNEDLVALITDWSTNNLIKKDRFNPSIYHDLISVPVTEYTWNPNGTHSGIQTEPQVRLGKDNKVSIVEVVEEETPPPTETLESFADVSFRGLSPIAMQELESFREDLPDDVIKWAICQSIDGKVRTWAYCRSILNRCLDKGLKTLNDVLRAEDERKKQKEAEKAKPNKRDHGYQERNYGSDEDYGIVVLNDEDRKRKQEEAEAMLRKEHPEWY